MIIEGPMLMGGLIIVALAIAALLVYIRLAVRKEDPEAESLFSRLLKLGAKDEEEEEEEGQETQASPQARPAGMGLRLPGIGPLGKNAAAEPAKKKQEKKKMPEVSAGGLFSGLLGGRKSKEKLKEEVRAIDEQLNSVLQESSEISVSGLQPQIGAMEMPMSDGLGMRELDLEMGGLNEPAILPPTDFQMETPMLEVQSPAITPAAAAPNEEMSRDAGKRKPDAPQTPLEAEPPKSAIDNFVPETRSSGEDLLADIESEAKQEELIDTSIMKEYQDMPLTCVELESDLKGILDQITINMQGKGRQQA